MYCGDCEQLNTWLHYSFVYERQLYIQLSYVKLAYTIETRTTPPTRNAIIMTLFRNNYTACCARIML